MHMVSFQSFFFREWYLFKVVNDKLTHEKFIRIEKRKELVWVIFCIFCV